MPNNTKDNTPPLSAEEIHRKIMKGYEAYREGRTQNATKAFTEFRKRYGHQLTKV